MEQLARQPDAMVVELDRDWRVIESLLPVGWMEQARQLGAFRRAGGIKDACVLLRVMLIHLAEGCGLRSTAARASLAGIAEVSDVALLKRLRSCGAWFEWLAQQLRAAPELAVPTSGRATALLGQRRLRLVDGSVVSEPGATGSQWRLHYSITLPQLHCEEVHLGPRDDGETLRRFQIQPGDILVADRGYAHPAGIAHVRAGGGDVMVRMNLVTLPLQDPDGQKLDILACVRQLQEGQTGCWPARVLIKARRGQSLPEQVIVGRLCAVKKSQAAANKARERVRRESVRNGTALQPQTLEAADYVLVFTTLGEDVTADQVMEIYRLRWQIELEFKRLKSLIQLGHLKKHDERAARSWLQGKLLVALLIARMIAHAERVSPWGYEISWFAAKSKLSVA
jgi:hypothetical protein